MSRRRTGKKKRPPKTPKYRLHKASGQGYAELDGRCIYFGRYELPESRRKYHTLIAEWEANDRTLPVPPEEITVVELLDRFWQHAKEYYRRPDGSPTGEHLNFKTPIGIMSELYGDTKAVEFGPRRLKTVRRAMIDRGNCRNTANSYTKRVKYIFRWAVAEELIPENVHAALMKVEGLKQGRSDARETPDVNPVPQQNIDAIQPFVSRQVWAMIQFQLRTGARPGDTVLLRLMDIDMTGDVWEYRPWQHKTAYLGHERVIYIGPEAQTVLREFLHRPIPAYVFSPKEVETERRAALHAERRTPLSCGNRPGTNRKRKPKREPGEVERRDELVPLLPLVDAELLADVGALEDGEFLAEFLVELALPLKGQVRGTYHEDSLHHASELEFADEEPGHDGLAGAGVVGQQEPNARELQQAVVDGLQLVWEGIDAGRGEAEVGVKLVRDPEGIRLEAEP